MKFNLANKAAVVTGGGSGIGEAICTTLAQQGATVFVLDIDEKKAQETAEAIRKSGGKANGYYCDISNQQQVVDLFSELTKKVALDILVNNAGIAHIGNVEETSEDDFDKVCKVNIKGAYNCIYAVIPHMKQNGGVILNMASVSASLGISNRFVYSLTKGAVLTMTYSVAKDYLKDGIRCNSISPARIHTPFVDGYLREHYAGEEKRMFEQLSKTQPIGRMGKPQEVADLALYLCSDEASFITGTDFPIDGGFTKLNT